MAVQRFNVTLDEEYAAKLSALAERTHVQEGTLARSLLSSALDQADPAPVDVAALLDGISGLFDRVQLAREQARTSDVITLDEL